MNKFNPGDRVRCINNTSVHLNLDDIYTIEKVYSDLFTYVFNDNYGYSPSRFELAYKKEFSDKLEGILNEET